VTFQRILSDEQVLGTSSNLKGKEIQDSFKMLLKHCIETHLTTLYYFNDKFSSYICINGI